MRIGLAEQTALVALAHAFVLQAPPQPDGSPSEAPALPRGEALAEKLAHAEAVIKQVYSEMPNYEVCQHRATAWNPQNPKDGTPHCQPHVTHHAPA